MNSHCHRDFDKKAASWDANPRRRLLAEAVTAGILEAVPLNRSMCVLEYGCGTGLVGLPLAKQVGRLIAMDTSEGMLSELRKKIGSQGLTNVETLLIPPNGCLLPEGQVDLLLSSMVLHHVEDIGSLLRNFHQALVPGGCLMLADLEREDGSFHDDPNGIAHFGFDPHDLMATLHPLGFTDCHSRTVFTVHKEDRTGGERTYPVFLVKATRQ